MFEGTREYGRPVWKALKMTGVSAGPFDSRWFSWRPVLSPSSVLDDGKSQSVGENAKRSAMVDGQQVTEAIENY
jgi:hypothetical protein